MEGIAEILWKLAYDLCTHEQVEQKWRFTARILSVASGERYSHKGRGGLPGQHIGKGSSRRNRRFKKRGKQSIGRSRGGLTTKIHMVTATDRSAVGFALSGGEAHDSPEGTGQSHTKIMCSASVDRRTRFSSKNIIRTKRDFGS